LTKQEAIDGALINGWIDGQLERSRRRLFSDRLHAAPAG
jgi:hypothetical protein